MRLFLFIMALLPEVWTAISLTLTDMQCKKPLPEEVADVYDEKRWQDFVSFKHDSRIPLLAEKGVHLLFTAFVIFSPLFAFFESLSTNIYVLAMITVFFSEVINLIISIPFSWWNTFRVLEKYGMNKKNTREFVKDIAVNEIFEIVISVPLYLGFAFLLKHIGSWTNQFHAPLLKAILVTAGICAVFGLFMVIASFASWFAMRQEYTFTELEDGELKDKILDLCRDAKKKIGKIEVYNESKKTTRKNAFLLKFLWIRRFGIADNFLNENAERELLGVLAHEAGHLKHRKTIWNYLRYAMIAFIPVCMVVILHNGSWILLFTDHLKEAFGVTVLNPMLFELAVMTILNPLFALLGVYGTIVTRTEEYEADRNAVAEGYGEDLIRTFKTLSTDELVDVNPHPLIEALTFSHPGMYNRIAAIRREIAKQK